MKGGVKEKSHGALQDSVAAREKPAAAVLGKLFGRVHEKKNDVRSVESVYLDPIIHERTRLSILTALFTMGEPGCSFLDLRSTLSLTDGNLMAHLRTLEEAELIERSKEGAGRKSNTTLRLSPFGRKAFKNYLDRLEMLVRTVKKTTA